MRNQPGVEVIELLKKPGSRLTPVRQSSDRSALALATGGIPDEALSRARDAIEGLEFVYVWNPQGPTPA
jgi:hypothetical protein